MLTYVSYGVTVTFLISSFQRRDGAYSRTRIWGVPARSGTLSERHDPRQLLARTNARPPRAAHPRLDIGPTGRVARRLCANMARALAYLLPSAATLGGQTVYSRILPLPDSVGVFSYARISPDGRYLVYSAQSSDPFARPALSQVVNVVDLRTRNVVFREPGVDGYWSPNGRYMIFQSFLDHKASVAVRDHMTGLVRRDVARPEWGDYYSWGTTPEGTNVIVTVAGRFFVLDNALTADSASFIPACNSIAVGDRPLVSKDGRLISVFVRGNVVVRTLADCASVVNTGIEGAKADFSFDSRYLAFHAPKLHGVGYEIHIVDLKERTVRVLDGLGGSAMFPSWTRDGRLAFYYEEPGFRGFILTGGVLSAPAHRLSSATTEARLSHSLRTIGVSGHACAGSGLCIVMIWATWSAHSTGALSGAQDASDRLRGPRDQPVRFVLATDAASRQRDVARMLRSNHINLPSISLNMRELNATEGVNQIPAYLLFDGDSLIDQRLGSQTADALVAWVQEHR